MVASSPLDVITGDWLSEMNIAWESLNKRADPSTGYDVGFLRQLGECIDDIAANKIKVVTNAGAMNAPELARKVDELCKERGLDLLVAVIEGDDVTHLLGDAAGKGKLNFAHLDHPEQVIEDWNDQLRPECAVAYIGAWGITAALRAGADIVICGRVTDASPVIGAAAWWYDWTEASYDELAGALIAGHLIECGPYACGANFSGFRKHLPELVDLAFPIAEILPNGSCYITKPDNMNGIVNRLNITAQLLYELQGELYLNPDVVADIRTISIDNTDTPNRVFVSGAKGTPPPSTTKVMIAATGGYQAETTYYINGLDVYEKAQMMRQQLLHIFRDAQFSKLSIELYGSPAPNPRSQQAGTVMLRVFAQARTKEAIDALQFKVPVYALRMQSYPGYHMNLDFRTLDPKPFMEIFPSTVPLIMIRHVARIPSTGQVIEVAPPKQTRQYDVVRSSYETKSPIDLALIGKTETGALGLVVHARSGDKANNSNIGLFVEEDDEYPWLQTLLTVGKFKELLGDDYAGQRVERCEFPLLKAVHL